MSKLLDYWKLILSTALLRICVSAYFVYKIPNEYRVSLYMKLVENKDPNHLYEKKSRELRVTLFSSKESIIIYA